MHGSKQAFSKTLVTCTSLTSPQQRTKYEPPADMPMQKGGILRLWSYSKTINPKLGIRITVRNMTFFSPPSAKIIISSEVLSSLRILSREEKNDYVFQILALMTG